MRARAAYRWADYRRGVTHGPCQSDGQMCFTVMAHEAIKSLCNEQPMVNGMLAVNFCLLCLHASHHMA